MSPSDLEPYLRHRPIPTLRLTLSSGDQLIVRDEDEPFTLGLVLILRGTTSGRMVNPPRTVSVPNIVLVEPVGSRGMKGRRRR